MYPLEAAAASAYSDGWVGTGTSSYCGHVCKRWLLTGEGCISYKAGKTNTENKSKLLGGQKPKKEPLGSLSITNSACLVTDL